MSERLFGFIEANVGSDLMPLHHTALWTSELLCTDTQKLISAVTGLETIRGHFLLYILMMWVFIKQG